VDKINSGDTAFVPIAGALVAFMTPGLAFFYGGLVRRKNVLAIMMQSFMAMGVVTALWVVGGFSLAFAPSLGGVLICTIYAFIVTVIILKGISLLMPVRVPPEAQEKGLDEAVHGETAYELGR
jgi:ammonia channel protein AmtB